jgi:DNA repair protein RecN (Recombination protein N)
MRNADQLRFVIDEIGRVDPEPGEDALIEARLPAFAHADRLAQAVGEAVQLLRDDGAATDRMALAEAALARVAGIDGTLDALTQRVAEISALADDVSAELREYRDRIEDDPESLEALQSRMAQLHGLMRRYGPTLADVIRVRDEAVASLQDADAGEGLLARARDEVEASRQVLVSAGSALDAARSSAAPHFVAELREAATDLAMQGVSFEVAFTELEFGSWTADGASRVEFLFSPATGQPARSLARIASGGELSRVMLALKGVLGGADTVETLVFDEVDAGVGGATAHAVGRRLAKLAKTHQVIVVTHLAQVAAYADAQLVVRKSTDGGTGATVVERVEDGERVGEIARMLSGNESETSLAHARELLRGTSLAEEPVTP